MTLSVQPQPFIAPSELNTTQKVVRNAVAVLALAILAVFAAPYVWLALPAIAPFAPYAGHIALVALAAIALIAQHSYLNNKIISREKTIEGLTHQSKTPAKVVPRTPEATVGVGPHSEVPFITPLPSVAHLVEARRPKKKIHVGNPTEVVNFLASEPKDRRIVVVQDEASGLEVELQIRYAHHRI